MTLQDRADEDIPATADARTAASSRFTVFSVGEQRFAIPLETAERVLPMIEIAVLPGAPPSVVGVINLHGIAVPVLDVRRRLGLPRVTYGRDDRLLIAWTALRVVALPVTEVAGVEEWPQRTVVQPDGLLPRVDHVAGVAAVGEGILLIYDLEGFFSEGEEQQLAAALEDGVS